MFGSSVLSWELPWNRKTVGAMLMLVFLPNILSMVNLTIPGGVKIHTFQVAIFLAASLLGPLGGLLSGVIGSLFSALTLSNPYLMIGNGILGFFTGWFLRRGIRPLFAVWMAFCLQLLWLIPADYFLAGLSVSFIQNLVLILFLSNTLWAVVAARLSGSLKRWIA
ncbi:MAG: ECF transporter S component [Deltaproteobacteria bacterium]|nr:ECF transporter S component [Deltaproteobacteria bacterium]